MNPIELIDEEWLHIATFWWDEDAIRWPMRHVLSAAKVVD